MVRIATSAAFALCLALLGACAAPEREVAIGFAYAWGDTTFNAWLQSELDRVRPAGKPRIRLTPLDSGGYAAYGQGELPAEVLRARRFVEDPRILVVVGPGGSRSVLQVGPILRTGRLAQIVPAATSRRLSSNDGWTFLLAPNDSLQGEFIAVVADSILRARSAVIYAIPDEYGFGLSAGTVAALEARRVRIVDRVPLNPEFDCLSPTGIEYYGEIAGALRAQGGADVAIIAAREIESGCLTRALRDSFPRIHIVIGDGTELEPRFLARARRGARGAYLVAHWHEGLADERSLAFTSAFGSTQRRRVGHGDAVFYDGLMLAAAAIWEGGSDRASVREYLRGVGVSRPEFQGVAGPISFAAGFRRPLRLTRVIDSTSMLLQEP